jgi:hypothetical protein
LLHVCLITLQVCAAIDDIDLAQQNEMEALNTLIRAQAGEMALCSGMMSDGA